MKRKILICFILLGMMFVRAYIATQPAEATKHTIDVSVGRVEIAESDDEQQAISAPNTGEYKSNIEPAVLVPIGTIATLVIVFAIGLLISGRRFKE